MRLSWNEIRVRAARFAEEWKDAHYEKGETQSFYNDFFEVFGVKRRRVASFEEPVKKLGKDRGFIDLFWKGTLLVEQKSAGRNLTKAKTQAMEYFPGLKEQELPRYVLVSDFQTFELYDLDEDTCVPFKLEDLPHKVEAFGFIIGVQKRTFQDQDPVNIIASELMGKLHDALKASGYDGHDLERLLVRLMFCLFADDTGIFEPKGILQDLIVNRTNEDGSDTGQWLSNLFDVLNTPLDRRQSTLDEDLAEFPYINGDLFRERLPTPAFNADMRKKLLDVCDFKWEAISPAIFGSLFQSVMSKTERRAKGAHYTTEKNILKVIAPLFLDDLRDEFDKLKARRDTGRRKALESFQDKLAGLRFFDPACGCGNFLIIAYRELRALEIELLKEIHKDRQLRLDVAGLSKIDVDQFYGIEIGEFAARIAEVALWMTDHIMNNRLSLEFGEVYARIPIKRAPHIHHADALEIDWSEVLPPADCSYVFGNPPFIGAKYQSDQQRAQVRAIAKLGGSGGTLDYVTAWFLKAGAYVQTGQATIGFVATNSITQGEQVAQLWPLLFDRYRLEIAFAHRTFAWGSDARGKAHVHVVIIGLARRDQNVPDKRLFSYEDIEGDPSETRHSVLSPYLFDASGLADPHIVIEETSRPINGLPRLKTGVQMIDNGILTFEDDEMRDFISKEPGSKVFFRKYLGGDEYINGFYRWILYLAEATPESLRASPLVQERIRQVRDYRNSSSRASTKTMANYPTKVGVDERLNAPYLVIPNTSSERRDYIPIGWLPPEVIANQKLRILPSADTWTFGLLTSRMHMAWMRAVTGRMKSDYMYSVGVVYNTFPVPNTIESQREKIGGLSQRILDTRDNYPDATLADLYDPDSMPPALRKAHFDLDLAIDKLYRTKPFDSDRERVEFLFGLYEKIIAPLTAATQKPKRRARQPKPI